jgi:NAD(P)-dependent dehydrogenase (short-subunit alcohol dehydrogenase family)
VSPSEVLKCRIRVNAISPGSINTQTTGGTDLKGNQASS